LFFKKQIKGSVRLIKETLNKGKEIKKMKILKNTKIKISAALGALGLGSSSFATTTLSDTAANVTSTWWTQANIDLAGSILAVGGVVMVVMGIYKAVTSDGDIKTSVGQVAGGLIVAVTGLNLLDILVGIAPGFAPAS
jgi:hypothetical protein